MSESSEKAAANIRCEIEQIDTLLDVYRDLFQSIQTGAPSLIELTAAASVIHSFYNGLENMFLTVAKLIDQEVPDSPQWHRDLLLQMSHSTSARSALISESLAVLLADYLVFRHFYRHSYSFILDWNELEKLATPLGEVWGQAKSELSSFLSGLKG